MCRVGVCLSVAGAVLIGIGGSASAAQLPQIELSGSNTVPACVTPGRLMAFLESRNRNLRRQFQKIAVDYMRNGEELGVRWDQAFYQMLLETNNLKFTKDVRSNQNNFAGLGATGGGEPGESFDNVSDGVRAHLQHVLLYATGNVDNPVAKRTRDVQGFGIIDKLHRKLGGRPVTFTDLAAVWAPGSGGYTNNIEAIANRFDGNFCNRRDPDPGLLVEAKRGLNAGRLARNAISRGRANGVRSRSGLGARRIASAGTLPYKVVNPRQDAAGVADQKKIAAVLPRPGVPSPPAAKKNCAVFTASYGGQKAVIIEALKRGVTNYTVLDVNQGKEKRETEAYIAAYARGGSTIGEYASQNEALDRAFQLCPDG